MKKCMLIQGNKHQCEYWYELYKHHPAILLDGVTRNKQQADEMHAAYQSHIYMSGYDLCIVDKECIYNYSSLTRQRMLEAVENYINDDIEAFHAILENDDFLVEKMNQYMSAQGIIFTGTSKEYFMGCVRVGISCKENAVKEYANMRNVKKPNIKNVVEYHLKKHDFIIQNADQFVQYIIEEVLHL